MQIDLQFICPSTRWTNRNATMPQGNHSAASLYLLWGFMVPLPSDEILLLQISVLCSLFSELSV